MDKHKFLLDLKLLNIDLNEIMNLCKEHNECFTVLKDKLDYVCNFILDDSNNLKWNKYMSKKDYDTLIKELRESTSKALGFVEKCQANNILNGNLDSFKYSDELKLAVQNEILEFDINNKSKILFIGSGAMPITAFTISNEVNSEIVCLDIDNEALNLSQKLSDKYGIKNISFSSEHLSKLNLDNFSHIIIASLVELKLDIAKYLLKNIYKDTKIILRYGNNLKSIFNYPLDVRILNNCQKTIIKNNKYIYENVVLEKAL
ncbi:nicotianamine synthase family protein [Clostridium sp. OS1-26]|uniref:nicotianamine synthase family protein n=1 Tax=Clostridium sp. OS1-26 TaxID=3070681 RepID=UPI0027DF8C1C|nr:nicotianamine synthase family protein [Clostridium sp. OS1-26]WML33698.1 nicotianamine synthase family protein [Clostridium sp. OS1-26]